MTRFWTITILAAIVAGCVGYRISCDDLLQQNFSARKMTLRVAELLAAVLVELILWLTSTGVGMKFVPFAVWLVVGILHALAVTFRKKKQQEGNDLWETGLRTTVSMCIAEFLVLLACLLLSGWNLMAGVFQAVQEELNLCRALLLGIGALAIFALVAYIHLIQKRTGEGNEPRALAAFRKRVNKPFRI